MKRLQVYLLLLALLQGFSTIAQVLTVRGIIKNDSTSEPIPYVNIMFENYGMGTSSNENGQFGFIIPDSLSTENIVISHVGFNSKKVSIQEVLEKSTILLIPKKEFLAEVSISQVLKDKRHIFRPENSLEAVGIGNMNAALYPSTIARFYPKPDKFSRECFIENIQIYFYPVEEQNHLSPKFRLHIYKVQEDGKPGEDLLSNLVLEKSSGQSRMKVELLDKKIEVPENGFFVGLEHLFLKENEFKEVKDYYINDSLVAKEFEYKKYAPVYKGVFTKQDSDLKVYYYQPGGWVNISNWEINREESEENYIAPVFKIRITD
ncbi:carboxypeptidase-like regulatory domain-containing protein [Christiangramia sp.]|uniref:carboxypeptidase-like regulatory domain-containing protein n=1 Tax=Christiangramia sp. TaxID=1931228 RepID=UPI00262A6A34|nr:carboxypeptidase-like regulatory domain-containing protein [Christiangramia sp.]